MKFFHNFIFTYDILIQLYKCINFITSIYDVFINTNSYFEK